MSFQKILIIAGAFVALVWLFRVLTKPRLPAVATELPPALKTARTWAKETFFESNGPMNLRGRIDHAFELENGGIVLTETKTRRFQRIYPSDTLQLSAYRELIQWSTRKQVENIAYVRALTPAGNRFLPLQLLPGAEVQAAYQIYRDLQSGKYPGERCKNQAICKTCMYQRECRD